MNDDRPVLVIGGSRGTGLLIARLLHQGGVPVRVLARDRARALTLFDQAVDVVKGDLTKPDTLPAAMAGIRDVIFTAGCRSGYPVREATIKATEYQGVINALDAARQCGSQGRFLYMTASGITTSSLATACLNLWKGNTLVWRRRAEDEIRGSGLAYTIIRTGVLLNRPGGRHAIDVTQHPLPLSPRYRIARADVAEVFVAALDHPKTARATFEIVWGSGPPPSDCGTLLDRLEPDAVQTPSHHPE